MIKKIVANTEKVKSF